MHHVREELTLPQTSHAVMLFLKNVMDNSLSLPIQMMSCKLLLNLVQVIATQKDRAGRQLLMAILSTFNSKLCSINDLQVAT